MQIMQIWNWAGLVLFALGAWLLVTALRRRQRALTAWRAAQAEGRQIEVCLSEKFVAAGIVLRFLTHSTLLAGAGAAILFYKASGGTASLAASVDLAGVLVLLLGYGTWVSVRTRYRDLAPVPAPAA